MMPETSSPHPAAAGLRQFVIVDLCAIAGGVLLCLGIYIWLLASPWVLGLAAVVAADGVVIASATRFLSSGQYARAATTVCAGTWGTALGVTLIAPATLPIMVLAAQMPVILALPYVNHRRLGVFMVLTVSCVLGLGMLGRLQDVSGVSVQIPDSFQDVVVIVVLPVLTGLILLIVWHNSAALRSVAEAATSANNALIASQHLLADRAEELAASRVRLVKATDSERRRIERDLHDGAQQHLVALAINLRLAQRIADNNPAQCGALLVELAAQLQAGIDEIRRLAHGIYPPLLASGGLAQAIPAAAAKAAVTTSVTIDRIGRYSPDVEAAVYFCCLEALQNTAKHAGDAATANISANHDRTGLTVTVSDNGCGFDPDTTAHGAGLTNMVDRVAVVGGASRGSRAKSGGAGNARGHRRGPDEHWCGPRTHPGALPQVSGDPYIDLETGVLRNRLGITDAAELAQAESELTSYRLIELRRTGLSGRYDLAHLQAFHRYIFGDLYNWAGELRSVSIGKDDLFCLSQHLGSFAEDVYGKLARAGHLRGLARA